MINFDSIEQLYKTIDEDLNLSSGSHVRFPIRIIFLSNYADFFNLLTYLKVKKIDLSRIMPSDNYWYKSKEIQDIISLQVESCVIYPLSEVLRFLPNNELQSILGTLVGIENTENVRQRIYIPLIGMLGKFSSQFWKRYYRHDEGAKVWSYIRVPESIINIYRLESDISTKLPLIENNRQWLSYWLSDRHSPVISVAKSLNTRWKNFLPDICFKEHSLENEKQLIEEIYSISISISFVNHERHFWKSLLHTIEEQDDIEDLTLSSIVSFVLNILDIESLNSVSLLSLLLECKNEFHRWLLKGYITSNYDNDNYLYLIVSSIQSIDDYEIIKGIYTYAVSNEIIKDDLLSQRRELIDKLPSDKIDYVNSFIVEFINSLKEVDEKRRLIYLTDSSKQERIYVCKLLKSFTKEERMSLLSKFSRSLYNYLSFKSCSLYYKENWITEYFHEYNYAKLFHEKNDKIDEIINDKNSNSKSFFDWYSQLDYLPEIKEGKIFQIDGFGLEWLSYIIFILEEESNIFNKEIDNITIHKAYLPSITSINKMSKANFVIHNSLDSYIHSLSAYKPYESLMEELDLISTFILSILKDPSDVIYITGDHGLSCQCLKQFGRLKKYDFPYSEHEGRCWKTSQLINENNDFIFHNGYYISLNHTSLYSLPKREVHGGATPEEILIPLIKIVNLEKKIDYQIELLSDQLSYSDDLIVFKIIPKPIKMPTVKISEQILDCIFIGDHFECDVRNLREGKSKISIKIRNSVFEGVITKFGGIKEEDPFE
ncbi:MAG: BREX-4 system phosphatase PglZ [Candidatus Delongbacteria bacterium]|nr:BREX-4 system phosphatase PglZ [Candidatus Delongbacteria bacterium]